MPLTLNNNNLLNFVMEKHVSIISLTEKQANALIAKHYSIHLDFNCPVEDRHEMNKDFVKSEIIYKVYQYNGHFYFGEEILSIPEVHRKGFNEKDLNLHLTKTDFNSVIQCPVAIVLSLEKYNWYIKNPKLSDYKIGSIITPIDIWNSIYNFLTAEPVIIDNRTDIQKLKSYGFDEKTSFRKM